jgi:dynein assembly factor 1
MTEMSKQYLKTLCKDHKLYTTPNLNDKLYLHYKGFNQIKNLEEYTGLKALWLEGNGLSKIENLSAQTGLRSLYLHENIFEKIEGLDCQLELDSLNLSKNYISKIENLSHMSKLTTLNVSHNNISTLDGVRHILELKAIQTIDLQQNKIDDPAIVDILQLLPDLRVLYLMGNPVVKNIRNYRKTIISKCKMLKYLDDRPVFEEERRRVDKWAAVLDNGGTAEEALEAERQELVVIRKEKDDADERNFKAFDLLMREGQAVRVAREESLSAVDQGVSTAVSDDVLPTPPSVSSPSLPPAPAAAPILTNPFSGEEVVHVPETEELRVAREARWSSANSSADHTPSAPGDSELVSVIPNENSTAATKTHGKFMALLSEASVEVAEASKGVCFAKSVHVDLEELD